MPDYPDFTYEDKFFVWARKIEDEVAYYEDNSFDVEVIIKYLEKCADLREEFLDPDDLTDAEAYYTEKINPTTFKKYGVSDPIYDLAFGD